MSFAIYLRKSGSRELMNMTASKDAITGFYVLPRLRGDNVILEVSPFKSSQSNTGGDNIDTLSAGTTITTQGRDNTGIWVRADLVQ